MFADYDLVRTQKVAVKGIEFAYRKFGVESAVPLILLTHFRASMDNWDPLLLNLIAKERTVVAFDNKGVASSMGATPETYGAMADDAADFIAALGYPTVDILGFSIGGAIAQHLLFKHSGLVRNCVLAASMPPGGQGILASKPEVAAVATKAVVDLDDFLILFFESSLRSQEAGREYLKRRSARTIDVEPATTSQTMEAQGKSRKAWAAMDVTQGVTDLKSVKQPVLVANGSNDVMISNPYSFALYQSLPNAQLILYPDSGHGFLFQYPKLFAVHLSIFLNSTVP